ncbi:MAG: hypothetical protein CM15mP125_1690 [Gammaproteobacteria bacterium]|nr:MAG: hypothetical protein CM15mP125_1690 [Gammaproteobacteria bacterium]
MQLGQRRLMVNIQAGGQCLSKDARVVERVTVTSMSGIEVVDSSLSVLVNVRSPVMPLVFEFLCLGAKHQVGKVRR